jgi:transposase InsO family protein
MPWKSSNVVDLRVQFIAAVAAEAHEPFSGICKRFGISRRTGYKWLARYNEGGPAALDDASSKPKSSPRSTAPALVSQIRALRLEHPYWGPKKLHARLVSLFPEQSWPAPSTIAGLLSRLGLILPKKKRVRWPIVSAPIATTDAPNDTWCVDFKGQFRLGDRSHCYPLTITDLHSRFIIAIQCFARIDSDETLAEFERVFRLFGLPRRIRSDNGVPFSTLAVGRLSKLSVRWQQLGIEIERIEPGHPEQNGAHERMHRSMKAEAMQQIAKSLEEQQLVFDRFRAQFNDHRPHEALAMKTPSALYTCSSRALPAVIEEAEYPAADRVLKVFQPGVIELQGKRVRLHRMLIGERVGVVSVGDNEWRVEWRGVTLGIVNAEAAEPQIRPAKTAGTSR